MANIKVPCNCEQRQLNAALESEIIACKAVNVLQVQEAIKATVYLNLLQDEIGKLNRVIHAQQEELNNRQYLLLSHDDVQRELEIKIKSLLSEIKSSEFLEKQNLELFAKVQSLNSELAQSNTSINKLNGEITQIRGFKDSYIADSLKAEAVLTLNISDIDYELKESNARLIKSEAEKLNAQQRLAKREQNFLLREELLLDQIARLKESKYESLNTVNNLTDKYYTAQNSLETKDHLITVSNLRNAVLEDRRSSPTPTRTTGGYQPYSF